MATVKYTIGSERDMEDMEKAANEAASIGVFVGARWEVDTTKLTSLDAAPPLAQMLRKWRTAYKEHFVISIDPIMMKMLRAAAATSDALRSAADMIEEVGGRIHGQTKYKRLSNIATAVSESAGRLPPPLKGELLIVSDHIKRAAAKGKNTGRGGRKRLLKIAAKINKVQGSPIELRSPAPARRG